MSNASHFKRGTGVYQCHVCSRQTRATGRGDNENAGLCAQCYELAGIENAISDGDDPSEWRDTIMGLLGELTRKGIDTREVWGDLATAAGVEAVPA